MANNEGTNIVALNNYLQEKYKGQSTASLSWVETFDGPRHAGHWTAVCKISGEEIGKGTAPQKNVAKDAAACEALATLRARDEGAEGA